MPLSDIVNVTISRDTRNVSQAGFGTLLIVGPNVNINSRLEYFTTAASAKAKINGASTLEEAQVDDVFAQNPTVTRIALGSIQASRTAVFAGTMTAGTVKGYVNGTEYAEVFDTDMDTTLDNLATAMAANADVTTAVYTSGTDTMVVTPVAGKTIGIIYDITAATGLTGVTETSTQLSETYTTALDAILLEQPDWYGLVIASRTIAEQEDAADWVESNKKFFMAGSADANIVDQASGVDTTSIAYYVSSQSLERTAVLYGANAATQGNDAGYMAVLLHRNPGTYTGMFKTIASVTVDNLTVTQSTNALAKYANTYERIGGVNIVREGKVGANEYIDVVIFIDWLDARITESVYAALVSNDKVPYTNGGIISIKSAIEQPLKIGQNRGGISPASEDDDGNQNGGYIVVMPALSAIPVADKTNRILQDVTFTAWLAGAIHEVVITGIVTL